MRNKRYINFLLSAVCLLACISCVEETPGIFSQSALGYIEYKQETQQNVLVGLDSFRYHAPEFDDPGMYPAKSRWLIYCKVESADSSAKTKEVFLTYPPIQFLDAGFKKSTDTLEIEDNELPISSLDVQIMQQNFLYLSSRHVDSTGISQENKIELFYTEKDTLSEYRDCNVYTLYARSYLQTIGLDTVPQNVTRYRSFDLSDFLEEKKKVEQEKSKTGFYIQIKYISGISRIVEVEKEEEDKNDPDEENGSGENTDTPTKAPGDITIKIETKISSPGEDKYLFIPID
ncbi:hypothetical protein [Parabacteroides pacaensis]|uniref:hypothetical protein n=1 Tax=Parabacteroides pacaensis TaxID=2086575 RepID=UPI00131E4309|nr:hypothetical protein [Parabacteroides pacaensis]